MPEGSQQDRPEDEFQRRVLEDLKRLNHDLAAATNTLKGSRRQSASVGETVAKLQSAVNAVRLELEDTDVQFRKLMDNIAERREELFQLVRKRNDSAFKASGDVISEEFNVAELYQEISNLQISSLNPPTDAYPRLYSCRLSQCSVFDFVLTLKGEQYIFIPVVDDEDTAQKLEPFGRPFTFAESELGSFFHELRSTHVRMGRMKDEDTETS